MSLKRQLPVITSNCGVLGNKYKGNGLGLQLNEHSGWKDIQYVIWNKNKKNNNQKTESVS